jgi:glucosamine--fructose-6-phosphate aminotransferase (isomerizing)
MCGIDGYVGEREAAPIVLDGLARLEYRGYDSVGIAVLSSDADEIAIHKQAGKIDDLSSALSAHWPRGKQAIGHTRWATHGKPTDRNAHPHMDCRNRIAVIHNGIVENHEDLRRSLEDDHDFESDTDTEVIPHLIEDFVRSGMTLAAAMTNTMAKLQGAQAILAMSADEPGLLVAARVGNAGGIVVGYGGAENYVASDLAALLTHTRKVVFVEDGEVALVRARSVEYTKDGRSLERTPQEVPYDPVSAAKGSYKHYMQKEISEQPGAILDTIRGRANFGENRIDLEEVHIPSARLRSIRRAVLVGMGTSLHAAMIGRHYIEQIAGIPAEVDNASEWRYRKPVIGDDALVISVSQSGETVDTLAAMELANSNGCLQVTICNGIGSQATRMVDGVVYTRCGLEIGVASTKTYLAGITALYLLACHLGQERGVIDPERMAGYLDPLAHLPTLAGEVLSRRSEQEELAQEFSRYDNFLFVGRGINYPVVMEGALKLKEVSYIHAEGYPAGEMKHGPIALIEPEVPTVAVVPKGGLRSKIINNIEQVKAREGKVIAIGVEGDVELEEKADRTFLVPETSELLSPVLNSIPMQLFAYNVAVRRGCDVDQPRNLAKTVTVE